MKMSEKAEFSKILHDTFIQDPKWVEWFMNVVYEESQLRTINIDGHVASAMLVSPYVIDFHGSELECDYISCVATLPAHRGKGLMRTLMHDTLEQMYAEEVPFATLIPASRPLYFIYDRMGFATAVYVNEKRYTALHQFEKGDYRSAIPSYEIFRQLEALRPCCIRHTEPQFMQAVDDCNLSDGFVVAVEGDSDSRAIAFVQENSSHDSELKVIDLLATDEGAEEAVLAQVREKGGEKPVIVRAPADDSSKGLRAYGMLRIVNLEKVLSALAKANLKIKMRIRITDSFLPQNNGTYCLESGRCYRDSSTRPLDLDVSAAVFAEILFSSASVGDLFNIPSCRPYMSLMLD